MDYVQIQSSENQSPISKIAKGSPLKRNQKRRRWSDRFTRIFFYIVLAIVFFLTENYLVSMGIISIGLMVYVAGSDVVKVFLSSFAIFFSSRHVIDKAANLVETNQALTKALSLKKISRVI